MNKLTKDNQIYLEINDNFILNLLETDKFIITKEEYSDFIKNSNFKNQTITCNIKENENQKKSILLNLGFSFDGIEFNPDTNELEELYSYNYKEELFIKDNVLKEILNKLEISEN